MWMARDKANMDRLKTENRPTNGAGSASDDDHDHGRDVPLPTNSQSLNKIKEVKTSSNADGGANNVSSKFPGPGVTNWHGYVTPAPALAPGPYYLPAMHPTPMPPYMLLLNNCFFPVEA
ncbi:hypothetical protein Q3G72_031929 [Acer saccharum]|nr:hypothetical protein Q3G72_031929 [Acer saccharum]